MPRYWVLSDKDAAGTIGDIMGGKGPASSFPAGHMHCIHHDSKFELIIRKPPISTIMHFNKIIMVATCQNLSILILYTNFTMR